MLLLQEVRPFQDRLKENKGKIGEVAWQQQSSCISCRWQRLRLSPRCLKCGKCFY